MEFKEWLSKQRKIINESVEDIGGWENVEESLTSNKYNIRDEPKLEIEVSVVIRKAKGGV